MSAFQPCLPVDRYYTKHVIAVSTTPELNGCMNEDPRCDLDIAIDLAPLQRAAGRVCETRRCLARPPKVPASTDGGARDAVSTYLPLSCRYAVRPLSPPTILRLRPHWGVDMSSQVPCFPCAPSIVPRARLRQTHGMPRERRSLSLDLSCKVDPRSCTRLARQCLNACIRGVTGVRGGDCLRLWSKNGAESCLSAWPAFISPNQIPSW
jgi:hypothetical protein